MFPMERYKFFTNSKGHVYAVSSYCGKTVKGVAKCDPKDTFDLEKGKKIAAMRCNVKICALRAKRMRKKVEEARKALIDATNFLEKMEDFQFNADADYHFAIEDLINFMDEL